MDERRGVPGNAQNILFDWFKEVKEEISDLSIGQRATWPAQRTVARQSHVLNSLAIQRHRRNGFVVAPNPGSAGGKHELQL